MIVPCNTNVTISVAFGGTTFNIPPSAYNLGPVLSGSSACVGGFSVSDGVLLRKLFRLLDCYAHHSHVEQGPGYLVLPSCETFTPSSNQ